MGLISAVGRAMGRGGARRVAPVVDDVAQRTMRTKSIIDAQRALQAQGIDTRGMSAIEILELAQAHLR